MGLIGMMSEPIVQMGPMLVRDGTGAVIGGPAGGCRLACLRVSGDRDLLATRPPLELQRAVRVRAASLPVALNPGAPATGR